MDATSYHDLSRRGRRADGSAVTDRDTRSHPLATVAPVRATPPRPGLRGTTAAMVAALALVLAGCVAPKEQTTLPEESGPPTQAPDQAGQSLDDFYGQDVAWEPCSGSYECA